ncbi:MAG: cytochrome C [Pseudomonadota bacterium]
MNLRHTTAGFLGALALLGAASASAQTISRGEVIASTCYTCHGTHGVSPSTIPSIDYIPAARIVETLKAYKAGTRYSTIMGRHASAYTDEEIVEAANHLASLPKKGK